MIRAGVVGASGLAGGDLVRLIAGHPELELAFLGGASSAGRRVDELHPHLRLPGAPVIRPADEAGDAGLDVLFLATPAPVSARLAAALAGRGPVVVDLSGAFRIRDPRVHERWYPKVERTAELTDRFVYGVPELVADRLPEASLISLPGCFATAMTLSLAPLVLGLGLDLPTVVVDGKTGSSGGGLHLRTADLHPYRSGAIAPYAPAGHRHAAEVAGFLAGGEPGRIGSLSMSAYGVSTVRGLLTSSYVFPAQQVEQRELHRAFLRFYKGSRFVRVRRHTETMIPVPDPQALLGSNYCDVTVLHDADAGRVVVLAALDNLVKGAAGQAVQAANLRFGLPEESGLEQLPVAPA